ncbi:GGDEF domain-containing protein [Thiorhodococcus fuscus]|uniref:diguanylate cyclase n=1 Tax=Thiorhodococcus fuscus TaxID=527200 RepID=A0ABW4YEL2_9GAMM
MDTETKSDWQERTTQQLVRYEALFKLLDDIQQTEDIQQISHRVAAHWKYFANVACWRMVIPHENGFRVIDGVRGAAHLAEVTTLHPWDAHHLAAQVPRKIDPADIRDGPLPPEHLEGKTIVEIQVLPFARLGQCLGLLTVAARRTPFNDLDTRFIRIFGSHFTERLTTIQLRQQAMEALLHKATRDALTGLLNRGTILEHLGKQLARARTEEQPLSVILADIDFFKIINDSHGHLAGDQVLWEVACRLRSHTLASDSLGRYGGEEFLFVLYPCTEDAAANTAEQFRRAIAELPITLSRDPAQDLGVTLSLGTSSTDGRSDVRLEELLKRADDALYRSKASGRNRVTTG